jgi:DNA-binding CsgD family transcriptional regulator
VAAPIPVAHTQPLVTRAWARSELGLDPGERPGYPLPPSVAGAGLEIEGLALDRARENAKAAARFEQAAAAWSRFHVPRGLVCRWAAGEQLRKAEDPRAVEVLRAALDAATTIQFEPLAARIRRSLRLAGVRVPSSRPAAGSSTGLTAREHELVTLVEGGLTNVEIARRLGLGRPTVARILASAMSKLGVSSRTQLAAHGPT